MSGDFEGLTVEDDGRISFHGATSLFNLPSGAVNESASLSQAANELEARKERLINNAWRERAFEQLNNIPVSHYRLLDVRNGSHMDTGTVSISARLPLVLDPAAFQLRVSARLHP